MSRIAKVIYITDIILSLLLIYLVNINLLVSFIIIVISILVTPLSILLLQSFWYFFTNINKAELFPINKSKILTSYAFFLLVYLILNIIFQKKEIALQAISSGGFAIYLLLRYSKKTSSNSK